MDSIDSRERTSSPTYSTTDTSPERFDQKAFDQELYSRGMEPYPYKVDDEEFEKNYKPWGVQRVNYLEIRFYSTALEDVRRDINYHIEEPQYSFFLSHVDLQFKDYERRLHELHGQLLQKRTSQHKTGKFTDDEFVRIHQCDADTYTNGVTSSTPHLSVCLEAVKMKKQNPELGLAEVEFFELEHILRENEKMFRRTAREQLGLPNTPDGQDDDSEEDQGMDNRNSSSGDRHSHHRDYGGTNSHNRYVRDETYMQKSIHWEEFEQRRRCADSYRKENRIVSYGKYRQNPQRRERSISYEDQIHRRRGRERSSSRNHGEVHQRRSRSPHRECDQVSRRRKYNDQKENNDRHHKSSCHRREVHPDDDDFKGRDDRIRFSGFKHRSRRDSDYGDFNSGHRDSHDMRSPSSRRHREHHDSPLTLKEYDQDVQERNYGRYRIQNYRKDKYTRDYYEDRYSGQRRDYYREKSPRRDEHHYERKRNRDHGEKVGDYQNRDHRKSPSLEERRPYRVYEDTRENKTTNSRFQSQEEYKPMRDCKTREKTAMPKRH